MALKFSGLSMCFMFVCVFVFKWIAADVFLCLLPTVKLQFASCDLHYAQSLWTNTVGGTMYVRPKESLETFRGNDLKQKQTTNWSLNRHTRADEMLLILDECLCPLGNLWEI